MIDKDSDPGTWQETLQPDNRSLQFLRERELHAPNILERIQQWHGCTMEEALAMKGEEVRRRIFSLDN